MASDIYVPKLPAESPAALGLGETAVTMPQPRRADAVRWFIVEALTCTAMLLLSCFAMWKLEGTLRYTSSEMLVFSSAAGVCWAMLLSRDRTQHTQYARHSIRATAGAVRVSLQLLFPLLPAAMILRPNIPWLAAVIAIILVPPILALVQYALTAGANGPSERSASPGCIVMGGADGDCGRMASFLLSAIRRERRPIIFLEEKAQPEDDLPPAFKTELGNASAFVSLLRSLRCELLVITSASASKSQENLIVAAQECGSRIMYLYDSHRASEGTLPVSLDVPSREEADIAAPSWFYPAVKRAFDLIVSSSSLLLLSPVFLTIAVLIRLGSRGPALFVQERVGEEGTIFRMHKFRSMVHSPEKYEYSPTTSEDPRITRVGRFLRRTSLDELPQLVNVFLGHMSLVGPRPEMPFIVDRYGSHHRLRLQVVPGITGLWQLSKDRAHPIHQNLHHDLAYIQERSFSLDVAILIHTLLFAMQGGI